MRGFLIVVLIFPLMLFAQHRVDITITELPSDHTAGSDIFIAGSFNGWDPGNAAYKLNHNGENYFIALSLPAGRHEFKFTRGAWEKVECTREGRSIANREINVNGYLAMKISVAGWQDQFAPAPKVSTASRRVGIIDTAFYMPQLDRHRRIWIYLPDGYDRNKRYPVLYMHDGQNVFDDSTSFSGEWGIDEYFDTTRLPQAIVVAVDHGGSTRINEYSPYDMKRFGKGYGKEYVDFLVNCLKPYIDSNYSTLRNSENTFIAGSSMGGLISMYAVLQYPEVFGGAGVFSPAFWVAPDIYELIEEKGNAGKARIYFFAGGQESLEMVPDMQKAYDALKKHRKGKMTIVIREEGKHSESWWRNEFPRFYSWLMGER